jgi:hypothetical protein
VSIPVDLFGVDMNGSSGITVSNCVELVELVVVVRECDGVGREEPGSKGQPKDSSELVVFVLCWVIIGRGAYNLDEGILPSKPLPTEYEEYAVPCRVCLLGLPSTLPTVPPPSPPVLPSAPFTGTYAGPGTSANVALFAAHRSYDLNRSHPKSTPGRSPASPNTGAR